MESAWNEIDLKIPPLITLKVANSTFVKHVRSVFIKRKSNIFNETQDELANTAALLSRLMARRKNSFHNMRGYNFVCKLNTALSRLLKLDVEHILENFFQMLPEIFSDAVPSDVPSRNSFEYVLIRIICVHKLYQRISYCCTESADYFKSLIKNNFFMDTITLFLAVIAKIWNCTNILGNMYCELYRKLIRYRKNFPEMKSNSYFTQINFPDLLEQFSTKQMNESESKVKAEKIIFLQKVPEQVPKTNVLPKLRKLEDIGMPLSRDSLKPIVDLSRIHNVEDVRRYFKEEDIQRSKNFNTCATKYILKHEWLGIQKLVEKRITANDHKKALSIFRKFITSKI